MSNNFHRYCPHCGSDGAVFKFSGLPGPPVQTQGFECFNCRHQWHEREPFSENDGLAMLHRNEKAQRA